MRSGSNWINVKKNAIGKVNHEIWHQDLIVFICTMHKSTPCVSPDQKEI